MQQGSEYTYLAWPGQSPRITEQQAESQLVVPPLPGTNTIQSKTTAGWSPSTSPQEDWPKEGNHARHV